MFVPVVWTFSTSKFAFFLAIVSSLGLLLRLGDVSVQFNMLMGSPPEGFRENKMMIAYVTLSLIIQVLAVTQCRAASELLRSYTGWWTSFFLC